MVTVVYKIKGLVNHMNINGIPGALLVIKENRAEFDFALSIED